MKRLALCMAIFMTAILMTSCKGGEEIPESTEAGGRQTIILARSDTEDFNRDIVDRLIIGFNNTSEDYYIKEQLYNSGDNLSMDIYAGKQIDLLCLGDWIDITPLYSKELLCDLYGFIDSDTEISRGDYVEPVLTALETNGKLYQMPYDFSVESAIARADLWGDDNVMTFEHIIEVSEEKGCKIPFDFTFDSYNFIPYVSSNFIDFETGTCNFTDGKFEEFLGFMKQYTVKTADIDREELYNMFINGEVLLIDCGFAYFDQIDYLESDAGRKIKFVGFPSETKNYHLAVPETAFAIFSQSKKQQDAFEFIKYCTSYKAYVDESGAISGGALSINKKALEFYSERSVERNSYKLDEEQKRQNNEEIMRQIYSVNGSGTRSGGIVAAVLSEETQLYFKGEKSAAEVCEIIQNRLSTYFNEQRS
ncbi:MAG: extracellular solute-binding protein [Oscillospiraceae bacterium]|nr:extracellular solute-binding protein [Oscillospiraceae bacterium]